jgi:hypothetical protein
VIKNIKIFMLTHGCTVGSSVSFARNTAEAAINDGRYCKKLYTTRVSSAKKFPRNSRLSVGTCRRIQQKSCKFSDNFSQFKAILRRSLRLEVVIPCIQSEQL